jgi:uncharacterized protein (DUF983 family)
MQLDRSNAPAQRSLATALLRGLRLRCPLCGRGRLFRSWFHMHRECSACGLKFHRGPGYYLGSIYINYGLTAALITAGYLALFITGSLSPTARLVLLASVCVIFPLWFFRYARSLWLALDLYLDPRQLDGHNQSD